MKINEMFDAIQGEGKYQGYPVTFVRLSGCTRTCSFCDTSYHKTGTDITVKNLANELVSSKNTKIVFTGGEPLIQFEEIEKLRKQLSTAFSFHLETNGDLIKKSSSFSNRFTRGKIAPEKLFQIFDYVCISPKELEVASRFKNWRNLNNTIEERRYSSKYDIKVVTDLDKVGVNMLSCATSLMPLTTYNGARDLEIRQKVWDYCVKNNLHYSARLHVQVWGKKQKV